MKKLLATFIIIGVISMMFNGCSLEENDGNPYPKGGRDTVAEFGIRRFAILRGGDIDENIIEWTLFDRELQSDIDGNIDNYIEYSPYVYTIGSKGNTKLNYETGALKQGKELSEFSGEDQNIFNKLQETKNSVVKK